MSSPSQPSPAHRATNSNSPAEVWNSLLRPDVELSAEFSANLNARMRAAKLTFGDRLHCPFLRPFFLTSQDEQRVREVCESIARIGERIVAQSLKDPSLLAQSALSAEEERLARLNPNYKTSSTASRLDAFLLPDSLQFAEYNAESPAGSGYSETLGEVFSSLEIMQRFRERFTVRAYPLMAQLLQALLESYREWGGTAQSPVIAIVDWCEVPTWTEFEILQARFTREGIPTIICDPSDLTFDGAHLSAQGRRIDLVYRRVLINDIVAKPAECKALIDAYAANAVCVANALSCKIPHKKAFFAVLTDDRNAALFSTQERELIRHHIPWTRLLADTKTTRDGESLVLLEYIRTRRDRFVLKPNDEYGGKGITLGWEVDASQWDAAIDVALADPSSSFVVQERIQIRREVFPMQTAFAAPSTQNASAQSTATVEMRDMLVDMAPYIFRGRMAGFLTRLSSTGLANVTSGGGQVPAFAVDSRSDA